MPQHRTARCPRHRAHPRYGPADGPDGLTEPIYAYSVL